MDLAQVFPLQQLFQIKLHPRFTENGLIYFSWIKTAPHPDGSDTYWSTTALGCGRWNGEQLLDLEEVFETTQGWSSDIGGATSSLHFLPDGTLLLGVSHRLDTQAHQSLDSHIGKVLRLNDDGTVPPDNPCFAVEATLPEIYTWGNRSVMDGDQFPNWQGNLFFTSMITGRLPGTGHLERVVFNEYGEIRSEQIPMN